MKPKKKKKSPLDGLPKDFLNPELRAIEEAEKADPVEGKRLREAYWAAWRKKRDEEDKDEADKKDRVGKYDPINFPLGTCRICRGSVVEHLVWKQFGEIRLGGKINRCRVSTGFYCKDCGVRYQFVPKEAKDEG